MSLPSVSEAFDRVMLQVRPLPHETVPLEEAHGRVLAEDIAADRDQPPFDASAMDGWAVRRTDALGEAAELVVVGESAAGHSYGGALEAGQAVRIFTGAAVPAGADLVVVQEEAERAGDKVRVGPLAAAKDNIRPRGGDFRRSQTLLSAGARLDPWRISLAASAGRDSVKVGRRPRVAFLSTGEELARPGGPARPDQIYESGSVSLNALAASWGAAGQILPKAGDDEQLIAEAVAGVDVDLIVTIGGASVGDYDLVKPALKRLGLRLELESVNVRPGKPIWFGALADGRHVLGLPGNPASAFVCAELFLRPILLKMQGAGDIRPRAAFARAGEALRANGPREHYMRATVAYAPDGSVTATPLPEQDSSLVSVLAQAGALLRRLPGAAAVAAGEAVEVILLDRL
jgi:molybdopterin molybdotransferase